MQTDLVGFELISAVRSISGDPTAENRDRENKTEVAVTELPRSGWARRVVFFFFLFLFFGGFNWVFFSFLSKLSVVVVTFMLNCHVAVEKLLE